jgi:hypothetical protein
MANTTTMAVAHDDPAVWPMPVDPDRRADSRTERKFCVPGPLATAALDLARGYLVPDALALGPQQRITSLYLDTPQLTFLRWHRERAADRFKLRIRRYGDGPAPTLYAEVKRKTGSIVQKQRAAFPSGALRFVLGNADMTVWDGWPYRTGDLEAFVRHRSQRAATPRMLVTCVRESLRNPTTAIAVTVDRDLRYQPIRNGDLVGDDSSWQPIPLPTLSEHGAALIELKYGPAPPLWMEELVVQLSPWRVSFSKYAAAMNAHLPAGIG